MYLGKCGWYLWGVPHGNRCSKQVTRHEAIDPEQATGGVVTPPSDVPFPTLRFFLTADD